MAQAAVIGHVNETLQMTVHAKLGAEFGQSSEPYELSNARTMKMYERQYRAQYGIIEIGRNSEAWQ